MTLPELKAQAARVFAEECASYEVQHAIGTSLYCVVGPGEFLPRFPSKADARSFITQRGLEAVFRMLEGRACDCPEIAVEGRDMRTGEPFYRLHGAVEEAFAALGRGEG